MCGADDAVVRAQARDTRLRLRPQVPGSPRGASCSCRLCHRRRYALSTHANPARPRAMVTRSLAPVCRVRCCLHSIVAAVVISFLAERAACRCCPRARPQCRGRHAGYIGGACRHRWRDGWPPRGPATAVAGLLPLPPRWPPSPPPAPMPSASPLAPGPLPLPPTLPPPPPCLPLPGPPPPSPLWLAMPAASVIAVIFIPPRAPPPRARDVSQSNSRSRRYSCISQLTRDRRHTLCPRSPRGCGPIRQSRSRVRW